MSTSYKNFNFKIIPCDINEEGKPTKPLIPWKPIPEGLDLDSLLQISKGKAVITGEISGITVIDIDSKESATKVEDIVGSKLLEFCGMVIKTKKGYHLYFKYDKDLKTGVGIIDGVDIRNDGGLAFSVTESKYYEPLFSESTAALLEIPNSLKEALVKKSQKSLFGETKLPTSTPYANPLRLLIQRMLDGSNTESDSKRVEDQLFDGIKIPMANRRGTRHMLTSRVYGICNLDPTIDEEFLNKEVKLFIDRYIQPDDIEWEFRELDKHYYKDFSFNKEWEREFKDIEESAGVDENGMNPLNRALWERGFILFKHPSKGFSYIRKGQNVGMQHFMQASQTSVVKQWCAQQLGCSPKEIQLYDIPFVEKVTYSEERETGFFLGDGSGHQGLVLNVKPPVTCKAHKRLLELAKIPQKDLPVKKFEELPPFYQMVFNNAFLNEEHRDVYITALATHLATLETPKKMVLISGHKEGTGKSAVTSTLLKVLYNGESMTVNEGAFLSPFNGEFAGKLAVTFDDVDEINSSRKEQIFAQRIKHFVSARRISIHPKGKEPYMIPNRAFYVMTSNAKYPMRLSSGDNRRILMLKGGEKALEEHPIYKELTKRDIEGLGSLNLPGALLDFEELFREGLDSFLSYLVCVLREGKIDLDNVEFSDKAIAAGKIENPINEVEGIVYAMLKKDLDALQEFAPHRGYGDDRYEQFLEAFEEKVVKANSPGMSVKELRTYFGGLWRHFRMALERQGVEICGRYSKWERDTVRFCVLNPSGDWEKVTDAGVYKESIEETLAKGIKSPSKREEL